jgi:DNA-binding CsgD family transcriptional regulator
MNDDEFKTILLKKIDMNNRLQALNLVKDSPSLKEKIEALSSLGIGPTEIADILGTTPGYVSVAISRIKKGQKKEVIEEVEGEKVQ